MITQLRCFTFCSLLALGVPAQAQRHEDLKVERAITNDFNMFGASTAIDGEWAVIGDLDGGALSGIFTGSCSVYRRTEPGWMLWQVLTPERESAAQFFGWSVVLVGDELIVGALTGGPDRSGAIYVYRLMNDMWTEVQQMRALESAHLDVYGWSLACDGQTLAVGAPGIHGSSSLASGVCYVYERGATGWVLSDRIPMRPRHSAPHPNFGGFGRTVALDGDVLVVGAPALHQGMAFVYRRGPSGWQHEADLYLPQFDPDRDFNLGSAIGLRGGTIALGAPSNSLAFFPAPSSVFVFEYDPILREWQQVQAFRASDHNLTAFDAFGSALVLLDDTLFVGAPNGAVNGSAEGTLYRFTRTDGVWSETERMVASDPNPPPNSNGAQFASSIAVDGPGNRMLVGAPWAWVAEDQWYSGGAYFFDFNQGTRVCNGFPNETEAVTRLTVTGNRVVGNANVSLTVYDGPPGKLGLFLVGPGGPPVPFGDGGSLCVGQPFTRLTDIITIGTGGSAMHQVDFGQPAISGLVIPGATLTFQFIHRDVNFLTHAGTFNASEAMEVLFE